MEDYNFLNAQKEMLYAIAPKKRYYYATFTVKDHMTVAS